MLVCDWCESKELVRPVGGEIVMGIVPGDEELHHGLVPDESYTLDLCEPCGRDLAGRMAVMWNKQQEKKEPTCN